MHSSRFKINTNHFVSVMKGVEGLYLPRSFLNHDMSLVLASRDVMEELKCVIFSYILTWVKLIKKVHCIFHIG